MANQLTMALTDTIQRLHQQGWSKRRIARELQIDRETVARYLAAPRPATLEGALSASTPATSEGTLSEPAPPVPSTELNDCSSCTTHGTKPSAGSGAASQCAPFHEQILAKLEPGLSAQRIWQDLVSEHGFYGQDGNDRLKVAEDVKATAFLFGGSGNDVLDGGAGNDRLIGGRGRNVLIGGDGADLLRSKDGSDQLFAGSTDLANPADWLAAWSALGRKYADRVSNVEDLLAGHLFDAGQQDVLNGGDGMDLHFFNLGGRLLKSRFHARRRVQN